MKSIRMFFAISFGLFFGVLVVSPTLFVQLLPRIQEPISYPFALAGVIFFNIASILATIIVVVLYLKVENEINKGE